MCCWGVVHAIKFGPGKTVITALGDISANFLQMILVAVGLGVIIASSELAFTVIKWFGVITLLYMGIQMLRSKPLNIQSESTQSAIPKHKLFLCGFLVAAGNPKAIVFFTALWQPAPLPLPNESLRRQMPDDRARLFSSAQALKFIGLTKSQERF